jgi:lysophospholipase L1-like esterase
MAALVPVEGYVPKLGRLLDREYGGRLELIPSGIGGETSTEGVERLGSEIRVFNPDLVLLLEGIVDVNNSMPRYRVARNNLHDMMRVVIRHDIPIIVGTYPPLNPEGFRIQGIDHISRLNDIIRQEAKDQNVPVADHEKDWNGDRTMQGPDGLHPNDAGYEKMAETWFRAIQDLVAGTST